jgi:hypothetical protein
LKPIPVSDLRISAMTIGEIQKGVERTRENDPAKAEEIRVWLDKLIATYAVVPPDAPAMREWARLMHRRYEDLYEDALIAATALVNGLTVATRNSADFAAFGVRLVNPFEHR